MPRNSDEAPEWPEEDEYVSLDAAIFRIELEEEFDDNLFDQPTQRPIKNRRSCYEQN